MLSKTIEVLIVDDQDTDREVTRLGLEAHQDLEVVGIAEDGFKAIELVKTLKPDVVVIDFDMPVLSGPETVRRLHSDFPEVPLIGFSVHNDRRIAEKMLQSGAHSYLSKEKGTDRLVQLIRRKVKADQN